MARRLCMSSLNLALKRIAEEGRGILLYLSQPNGGVNVDALSEGKATEQPKMDFRDYGIGAQIMVQLGVKEIRLLSSRSRNVVGLEGFNLKIVEQVDLR